VVGVIPKEALGAPVPERHLGLVPPQEYGDLEELQRGLLELVGAHIDLEQIRNIAQSAPPLDTVPEETTAPAALPTVKIGYLKDSAFSFYYPENLEALERAGAELVAISALTATRLPDDLSALYIGGGFPETHGQALSANQTLLRSVREAAEGGLPIYAECGGLMLLARAILWKGSRYEMANVLPFDVEVSDKAQGHGYIELRVDTPNPFFAVGTAVRGHEFHYSSIAPSNDRVSTACEVRRGTGCFHGRDAAIVNNVWASYTHVHALATPEWVNGLFDAARNFLATHSIKATSESQNLIQSQ
jgi:cobyrinic acid a,c-diamide synthase